MHTCFISNTNSLLYSKGYYLEVIKEYKFMKQRTKQIGKYWDTSETVGTDLIHRNTL